MYFLFSLIPATFIVVLGYFILFSTTALGYVLGYEPFVRRSLERRSHFVALDTL